MSRLIETKDGVLVEVDGEDYQKCSAGTAEKVEKGLDQIGQLLVKSCQTMKDFWQKEVEGADIEEIQVQFGLNFEASGSLYIAQAKAGASITVTATLKKPAA